jgi:hypothetical protein
LSGAISDVDLERSLTVRYICNRYVYVELVSFTQRLSPWKSAITLVIGYDLRDSSTYVKFYMDDFLKTDFQKIVFGSDPQKDLIQLIDRLIHRGDAPTCLNDIQTTEINKSKKLLRLKQKKKNRIVQKLNRRGWILKSAPTYKRGVELLEWYRRSARKTDVLRKKLYEEFLIRSIHKFHITRDGEEIAR